MRCPRAFPKHATCCYITYTIAADAVSPVLSSSAWPAKALHLTCVAEGHKTPEVLKLNPRGQVPVLKDGDVVVSESLATLQYLEEAYPDPCLVPKEASPQVCQPL